MTNNRIRKLLPLSALLVLLTIVPTLPLARATTQPSSFTHLTYVGTTSLSQTATSGNVPDDGTTLEIPLVTVGQEIAHSGAKATHVPSAHIPTPSADSIASTNPNLLVGFNGISHRDQRRAGTGIYTNTQFSLEPPDQGLCVGTSSSGTFVLETVNTVLRVFTTSGTPLTVAQPLNQFFNVAPEVIRSSPPVFGPFTTDPKCYFDPGTGRFFLTAAEIDIVPSTGALGSKAHEFLAVSQSSDPTMSWNLFSLDVTDDGTNGTPTHPSCPCFGDQPLIGADSNGFYISTNEFNLSPFGSAFNGAQIYAMSKFALAAGMLPTVVQFNTGTLPTPDVGGIWFSIQPATTPPGGTFAANTEFFLSSLDFFSTVDNRLAVWAVTNTNTLSSSSPTVTLSFAVINSEVYGQPPAAVQQDGPRPLGTIIIPSLGGQTEKLEFLAGNDDRMNQVVFANGELWAGVNTVVQVTGDLPTTVGIAWFIVSPSVSSSGQVGGSVVNQGYVAAFNANVMFPSIGVNAAGRGVIAFTLVGEDFFPSAAYATLDAANGVGAIHIAGVGQLPEDGFTGYHFFGSPDRVARWGDYSAAVADSSGNIWMSVEYIPNAPRTLFANWGTFVSQVSP